MRPSRAAGAAPAVVALALCLCRPARPAPTKYTGLYFPVGQMVPDYEGSPLACEQDYGFPLEHFPEGLEVGVHRFGGFQTVEECCRCNFLWRTICFVGRMETYRNEISRQFSGYNICLKESNYPGSDKWYKDPTDGKCRQDCWLGEALISPTCTNPGEDNVVYPYEGVTLYDDPAACCDAEVGDVSAGLCDARSRGAEEDYAGSYRYYRGRAIDAAGYFHLPVADEHRCVQDCAAGDGPPGPCVIPGGIVADAWVATYPDAATCCLAELGYIDQDLCQTYSYPWFPGTRKYYADPVAGGQCVLDRDGCPVLTHEGVLCRLVPDVSTPLYDTVEDCCAGALASIDPDLCRAKTAGVPSGMWFVGGGDGDGDGDRRRANEASGCSKDCDEAELTSHGGGPAPYCAEVTDVRARLYDTPQACCAGALWWINEELCVGRSLRAPTEKWFVADWAAGGCAKDCGAAELAADAPHCADDDPGVHVAALFDSAAGCCRGALSWIDASLCARNSDGVPSEKWFLASYLDGGCAKDCGPAELVADAGAPAAHCADVPTAGVALFESAEACCAGTLWWVDAASCAARSTGNHTDRWYADYVNLRCAKDCADDAGAPPECAGSPSDMFLELYDDSAACCAAELGWMDAAACAPRSAGSTETGSGLYYADWHLRKCVRDCEGAAPCGGLAEPWEARHGDANSCCETQLFWVALEDCIPS